MVGGGLGLLALSACQSHADGAVGQVVAQHEWETPEGRQVNLEVKVIEGPGKGERVRLALSDIAGDEGPGYVLVPGVGGHVNLVAEKRVDGLYRFELVKPAEGWPWWWVAVPVLSLWVLLKVRRLVRRRRRRQLKQKAGPALKTPG